MKPNELRIGNYVQTKDGIFTIRGIQKEGLWICPLKSIDSFSPKRSSIKPIPLTEEWLLKFGFKTRVTIGHSVQYFIGINPITRDWLLDILWLEDYKYPFYRNGHFEIKYVHQLQNLYFALTNEELTYDL
jgi:hypothetical protein